MTAVTVITSGAFIGIVQKVQYTGNSRESYITLEPYFPKVHFCQPKDMLLVGQSWSGLNALTFSTPRVSGNASFCPEAVSLLFRCFLFLKPSNATMIKEEHRNNNRSYP